MDGSASNDELETFIYANLEAGTFQKNVRAGYALTRSHFLSIAYSAAGRPRLTKPSGSLAVCNSFSSASVASRWRFHIWA